ncbi:hypothetical protein CT0861_10001 [Colletotrichum tofieldiae]|uniref:Uncharacterized protein n=1 Tax=Colletotrichum tofieldiae TaxID=708197 RepID=A0A166QA87_9PEZI|nr:hypothetical protein CT0861_10001 [Colletotrichum tofieldiae]
MMSFCGSDSSAKVVSDTTPVDHPPRSMLVHHRSCLFQPWPCHNNPGNFDAEARATSCLSDADLSSPDSENDTNVPKFVNAEVLEMEYQKEPAQRKALRCFTLKQHSQFPTTLQQRTSKHRVSSKKTPHSKMADRRQ